MQWEKLEEYAEVYVTARYNYTWFENVSAKSGSGILKYPSKDPNANNSAEYVFDVKMNVSEVVLSLTYDIDKGSRPVGESRVDLKVYFTTISDGEKTEVLVCEDTREVTEKVVVLDNETIAAYGYGVWHALVHHYAEPRELGTADNIATYHIEIFVKY
jgi:hypothetical protein